MYVTSLAKTRHVCTTTEFNFITPAYRYTKWQPIPSVSITLCINWFAFLEVILSKLQITTGTMAPMEGANWVMGT